MFGKVIFGTVGTLTVASFAIPPFGRKLDRNILRPIRNYNEHLNDWNEFKTEEEFYEFLGNLGSGFINMFRFESDQ